MDRLPAASSAGGHAPLGIRANPMLGSYAATVCAIVHDEMFFLPAFLDHYRRLGADRFIILDDCSTDGTTDFLAAQPDVMVVGSGIRYFAQVSYPSETLALIRETRAVRLWRDQMLDQFCTGRWAVMVDPDEFLALPVDLPTFFASLAAEGAEAAWGAMIDMYPERVGDILGKDAARFHLEDAWYFDAKPHLDPRQLLPQTPPVPRTVYPGSVARLFATWGVLPQGTLARRIRRRLSGYRYQGASPIHKTPMVFWRPGNWFLNCHVTSKPVAPRVVPIMHFKFTADLGRKIDYALATGSYNQGSRSYRLYASLIERMRARDAAFLAGVSRHYRDAHDFTEAGIAR